MKRYECLLCRKPNRRTKEHRICGRCKDRLRYLEIANYQTWGDGPPQNVEETAKVFNFTGGRK